jgi:hypothetical protein
LINDVPDGPGDRHPHRPRTAATFLAALAAALLTAAVAGCGEGGGEGSATGSTGASVSTTAGTSSHSTATTTTTGTGSIQTHKTVNRRQTPTVAVKRLLLSSNPRTVCSGDLVTSHYLQAAYGGRGGCVNGISASSAANGLPGLVSRVNGDKATVTVQPSGGIYDGEGITVDLIRSGSGWQVDAIKSNAPVGP